MGVWDAFQKSLFTLSFCSLLFAGCGSGLVQDGADHPSRILSSPDDDSNPTDLYRNHGTFVGNPPVGELVLSRYENMLSCDFYAEVPSDEATAVISLYFFDPGLGAWISLGHQIGYHISVDVSGYAESALFECRLSGSFDFSTGHKCKPADLNNDGTVTFADLDTLNSYLSDQNHQGDVNRDSVLNAADSDFIKACVNMSVVSDGIPIVNGNPISSGGGL